MTLRMQSHWIYRGAVRHYKRWFCDSLALFFYQTLSSLDIDNVRTTDLSGLNAVGHATMIMAMRVAKVRRVEENQRVSNGKNVSPLSEDQDLHNQRC
jgi:hypothetical protein